MINIDTRLLGKIDERELWFLIHIVKRIGPNGTCWPSNARLCEDTGWNIDKVQKVKASLMDKGLLKATARPNSSNVYKVMTEYLGVYIAADSLEMAENDGTGKSGMTSTGKDSRTPTGKSGTEVLSNEVLSNEHYDAGASGDLFSADKTKKKKGAEPDTAYKKCVEIWLKVVHPGWVFGAVQGKAMKSLLVKIRTTLKGPKYQLEGTIDQVCQFFSIMCANFPEFFRDKDLSIIDSKYNEIVTQIEHGKGGKTIISGNAGSGSSWIDELYRRAGQTS